MKTIKKVYNIKAPIKEVWQALVNPTYINAWGGGPAKMDDKIGTKFSLWGNQIHGKNLEVVEDSLLKQEWWGGRWDEPSITTFTLQESNGKTKLQLLHEKIPDDVLTDINSGWDDYYIGPMKTYLEKK